QVDTGGGGFGAAWSHQLELLSTQGDQIKASLDSATISLGTGLTPAVKDLLTQLQPVVTAFADWARQNPDLLATILKVTAVIGAVGIAGSLVAALAAINPLFLAIGIAIALLITHWDEFRAGIQRVTDAVKTLL